MKIFVKGQVGYQVILVVRDVSPLSYKKLVIDEGNRARLPNNANVDYTQMSLLEKQRSAHGSNLYNSNRNLSANKNYNDLNPYMEYNSDDFDSKQSFTPLYESKY